MKKIKKILRTLFLLVVLTVISGTASATVGELVGSKNFNYQCVTGVGIAYDGSNLWASCSDSSATNDLFKIDSDGNVIASYNIISDGGLGALSYDATRNAIWAGRGWGGSSGEPVYRIDLNNAKEVTGSSIVFTVPGSCTLDDGLAFDANNIADPSDDVIYYSNDCWTTTIRVFNLGGSIVDSFPFAGTGPHNSGLAIGGQLLYEADMFNSITDVVDKTTKVKQFEFNTAVAGDPNFHPEDLECDTTTFASLGKDVMWSKEAYAPMRAHAFEIPKGSCGSGGKPPEPPGNDIPEFPTVALPIAAVLGIIFLMQRRKHN